jgi:hypothetical protein
METKKMSLANIQGKLSRGEMKKIMAGSGDFACAPNGADCPSPNGVPDGCCGTCKSNSVGVKACYPA